MGKTEPSSVCVCVLCLQHVCIYFLVYIPVKIYPIAVFLFGCHFLFCCTLEYVFGTCLLESSSCWSYWIFSKVLSCDIFLWFVGLSSVKTPHCYGSQALSLSSADCKVQGDLFVCVCVWWRFLRWISAKLWTNHVRNPIYTFLQNLIAVSCNRKILSLPVNQSTSYCLIIRRI